MRNYERKLYKNHGKAIGTWTAWTEGAFLCSEAQKTTTAKATSNRYEAKGKNIGRANETTPAEQAVLELESKTRLKLDKGYVASLAEAQAPATNTLGLLPPMLATQIEKVKPEKICWETSCVQPKLDGHRALYKDGVLYSRQGKPLEHLDHIIEAIKLSGLNDYHLDGEIYMHGEVLQDVGRAIKKFRPETLNLEYHIYDQILDAPFKVRIGELAQAKMENEWDSVLQAVKTDLVTSMDEVYKWQEYYRNLGYEGTMLRFSDDPYRSDHRSRTLLKIKEFHDAEFRVEGVIEGKPYIRGTDQFQVPVWICATSNHSQTFNVTAQGDMAEKDVQWAARDSFIGKLLTVKYHYLSKDGVPQLPVALRWKDHV